MLSVCVEQELQRFAFFAIFLNPRTRPHNFPAPEKQLFQPTGEKSKKYRWTCIKENKYGHTWMAGVEDAESERPCRSDKRLGERMELLGVATTVGETGKKKKTFINTQKC